MKTKRITGFLALTIFAVAGMMLPLGLFGQTNDVGVVSLSGGPAAQPMGMGAPAPYMGGMPQYMTAEPSVAAYGTQAMPQYFGPDSGVGFDMTDPTSTQLFGPQLNFDANLAEGLGYSEEYFRLNAMVPWHLVPGQTVLLFDVAASVTDEGKGSYNGGIAYRNFDASRNRIFGWNAYYDLDQGVRRDEGYHRIGVGMETLGKYLDFRVNGYYVLGTDTQELSSQLTGNCDFIGHNIVATRERLIETAFSGVDTEAGGPLPFLGHYGINGYLGGYYLDNDEAGSTVGVSARVEALINDATTANFTYTNDDLLGDNAYASVSVSLPRWRTRGWFKPRVMQERLGDPIRRSNRIHTEVATYRSKENVVNPLDGQPYELLYVDPNRGASGDGTAENPFRSLEALASANASRYDILSVAPRTDNTSTNLSVDGGLDLFAGQQLIGRQKSYRIFETDGVICDLPSLVTDPEILAPLITNPSGGPGSYVVSLSDNNVVNGMRIDANGGRGIIGRRPLTDFTLTCNTIFNHTDAVVLNNVKGRAVFSENTIIGEDADGNQTSSNGLVLSVPAGETLELLAEDNTITGHTGTGMDLLARPGSRIEANDPEGNLGERSGILNNETDNNGRGIRMEARAGATIVASVEDNQFNDNTLDGFMAVSDAGKINFRSFARNTGNGNGDNGVFFHYKNGGEFFVLTEDANENGVFDPSEDVNGNGVFDLGFVQNELSGNGQTGLCIFGQGSGRGVFDIGGPDPALGNTFLGNADAGIAVDLTGTARAQVDTMFNLISSGAGEPASLTIILDFIDPAQGTFVDPLGRTMTPFDPTNFGFQATDFGLIANSVKSLVEEHYLNIVTSDIDSRSPIPAGMQLDVDFIIGDNSTDPGTGNEYYAVLIGDSPDAPPGLAGQSYGIGQIRDATGVGPTPSAIFPGILGDPAASVYADQIASFSPGLNPPDAFGEVPGASDPYPLTDRNDPTSFDTAAFQTALTSGDLDFTTKALGLITSHELGHALSLRHVLLNGSVTPNGNLPIMATPALDGSIQALISDNEFGLSGTNPEDGAPFVQNTIQQLVDAIGLRRAGSGTGSQFDGIRVRASNNARLEASRFLNNEITANDNDGLAITMNDNAKAEGVDIQGNTIADNGGRGVHLEARGPGAMIFADRSIGGDGFNTLGGNSYTQRNVISGNVGDGIQVLAANGGMINGNVINNEITANSGNGIALLIEQYGTLDFGDVSGTNNRIVRDNIITDNGGFGILTRTESVPGELTVAKLITDGNQISNNAEGGLFADLTGSNNTPPAAAAPVTNSTFDLTVRNETFDGNSGVGIGVHTGGNTKANVLIENSTITNTQDGALGGDGINFQRLGSSYLEALVLNNNISNNFGDGMDTLYGGSNRFDVNQPMSGTINSVTWNDNTFNANGANGVAFRGRGDAQMMGDGMNNTISNNGTNGILVDTREFSTFGDPSDFGFDPPGRRTVFKSNVVSDNGEDGIRLASSDDSRQLIQVTSAASSAAGSPHVAGPTDGDTVISGNGSDGIHMESTGASDIDLLVNSGAGQTYITENGVLPDGGNGIRFDASGTANSTLTVQETIISGSVAGRSEDANGNGVLDGTEDASGDPAFVDGNGDIDVQNGDGIQFNVAGNATPTLQVGGEGLGNRIHSNGDDGIAITARGSNATGQSRPVINVQENTIGGFDDGAEAGNVGDGMSMNIVGGTSAGGVANVRETGPIVTATVEDNVMSLNGRRGANFRITGASGEREREVLGGTGPSGTTLDMNLIVFNDNVVRSNGLDGVFFQANAGYLENRSVNVGNNGPLTTGNGDVGPYSPLDLGLLGLNTGTLNGQSAYRSEYLNLRTAQNTMFEALRNEIKNNGASLIANSGTGMTIRVSPNAYVAADVQSNTFGGNLDGDFLTESFNTAGNPNNAIDNINDANNPNRFDVLFLDDTAQLDLRFNNNSGNQIEVTAAGFTYTNNDPGKNFNRSPNNNRAASLFQVDNGPLLNNPNNIFSFQGSVQDIRTQFSTGGYNERGAADPLFPNIAFPPALP